MRFNWSYYYYYFGKRFFLITVTASKLSSSDSERIDSAQFFRNNDSRDVSRMTVSTLPLTSKYPKPLEPPNQLSTLPLASKYPKLPEPPN